MLPPLCGELFSCQSVACVAYTSSFTSLQLHTQTPSLFSPQPHVPQWCFETVMCIFISILIRKINVLLWVLWAWSYFGPDINQEEFLQVELNVDVMKIQNWPARWLKVGLLVRLDYQTKWSQKIDCISSIS